MKKTLTITIFLLTLSLLSPRSVKAQILDVIDFMRANFNYNGFTQTNSYLGRIVHIYDKAKHIWTHMVESSNCPAGLENCQTGVATRLMSRQKPGENIIYLNKEAYSVSVPGVTSQIPEAFWFNGSDVYDFEEGFFRGDLGDTTTLGLFGLFHNFAIDPKPENLPLIQFPNRGTFWTKRFIPVTGYVSPWFSGQRTQGEYRNMILRSPSQGGYVGPFAYTIRVNVIYHPNFDTSTFSWNGKPDISNLPQPLNVIEVFHQWKDAQGNDKGGEKYFYAKSGPNTFGFVRYEYWEPKVTACGSTTCCTTPTCDSNNPDTLTLEDTAQNLTHYNSGEDSNRYFNPDFYSDPKLEKYPGTPSNGALQRGAFQLPGAGQTTNGTSLKAGDWVQLTEVLTDADWMLSKYIPPNQCPDGYQFLGSFAPPNFIDHQTNSYSANTWSVLCGTNKNVLLATSCPANYESRGWFYGPDLPTSSYDYQGKDVSRQKVNYCVLYNEFHYPKLSSNVSPTPATLPGDFNNDGKVDINDYKLLISNFGNPYTIYDYAKLAGAFPKAAPAAPTPCGQRAGCRSTD